MTNSPIAALATGMIASRRLDNVPNSEGFRNTFFLSSLLCGNAGAQLVFNMRLADEIGDALRKADDLQKANKALQEKAGAIAGEIVDLRKKNEELKKENTASQEKTDAMTGEIADLRKHQEELKKENTDLKNQLVPQGMVILQHPQITGPVKLGKTLKAVPGRYDALPNPAAKSFVWIVGVKPEGNGETFEPKKDHVGQDLVLVELLDLPAGSVRVTSPPVVIVA